jgi:hypothetical protein
MNAERVAQVADGNGDKAGGSAVLTGFDIEVLTVIGTNTGGCGERLLGEGVEDGGQSRWICRQVRHSENLLV